MNYIINPILFYWMSVVDAVKATLLTLTIISSIAFLFLAIARVVTFVETANEDDDEEVVKAKSALKKAFNIVLGVLIISTIASIFIPSKNTLIEMQVAKYATYENTEQMVENIKIAVDYVVESIKSLK